MPRVWPGLTVKATLLIGLGLTIGIWVFVGYDFTQRMTSAVRDQAMISARYTRAQEQLTTARSQLLLASVIVRDALLDPNAGKIDDYRHQLDDAYTLAEGALRQYVPVVDSDSERDRVTRLRQEIDDFRTTSFHVLSTDRRRWPVDAAELLRKEVMPKRTAATQVADELQAINRASFVQDQNDIAGLYRTTERRVWESLGFALVASLGIALIATVYAGRLEHRVQRQHEKDARNTLDLHRLSAQLISVQEDERRTIARELHDEIGQALTAIKVELAVTQKAIQAKGIAPDALDEARAITDGALHAVRDLSHLLHPPVLDDLGLPAAIEFHLKAFSKRHAVHVDLLHEGMAQRAGAETEVAAYRIVQEALTNVARHARAATCRVILQRLPSALVVTIEDDGTGFDAAEVEREPSRRGLGLVGIRERVAQLHGSLRIDAAPGHGTRLTVELPAPATPGAEAPRDSPAVDAKAS